jgi:hypothetical protein
MGLITSVVTARLLGAGATYDDSLAFACSCWVVLAACCSPSLSLRVATADEPTRADCS